MVENCAGPSELYLKKELTAIRKARLLRDPETCSSWRSPFGSKSFAVTSALNHLNGTSGNSVGVDASARLLEIASRSSNRRKKVYLYNWRHHSSKSSDSGIQLDEDNQKLSVEGSPEDNLCDHGKLDYKSLANFEVPVNSYSVRGTSRETPVRRTARKLKRTAISKQRVITHSDVSKLLDLPSSSLGDLDSVVHSDDTEYCNSENLRQLTLEVTKKDGYVTHVASPLFSGSGFGNRSHSSKILRSTRRAGSSHSCTPASTSSYYRYGGRNPSTVGSWDETAGSSDGDNLYQMDLPGRQGCGLPCYSSKRARGRRCRSYSPSLSNILRRKGSSILCGSRMLNNKKRSFGSNKKKYVPKSSQGLPLLTNSCDGGYSSVDTASDKLSTNIGELDLEALSRLDGRAWSNCKSYEQPEPVRVVGADLEMADHRSLSQKYRPRFFSDIIGQNIVVHSLSNAILRGRIAPSFLFHGPRGTGKTSTARLFAAALNCLSTENKRPCGFCRECTHFSSGNGSHVTEVDATDKKGLDRVRYLLKNMSLATAFSHYEVIIIDQCQMLSSKMWSTFRKFLEEPPPRVVFIFITIDLDNLSRAIMPRCQKYLFCKVKDVDIVSRLRKLSAEESLDVELDALNLIATNSDGSLQDAETLLDQLSLLGKRITSSLVNDLVGVVSDEKLLDLLEIAMSSDTAETVKKSRELVDSGVDPMALMSQLAGLIMDIIAGTYRLASSQSSSTILGGRSLTEAELERLQQTLKILSDAEKQLRLSSERSTWFTAALLQLGSVNNAELSQSCSKQGSKKSSCGAFDMEEETLFCDIKIHPLLTFRESNLKPGVSSENSSPHGCISSYRVLSENLTSEALPANRQLDPTHTDGATGKKVSRYVSPDKLAEIWKSCIGRCHSKTLRQLLCTYGKLSLIIETDGALIAYIEFQDSNIKTRAERYLSSITDSIEIVLKQDVEVRIELTPENYTTGLKSVSDSAASNHTDKIGYLGKDRKFELCASLHGKKEDCSEGFQQGMLEKCDSSLVKEKRSHVATCPVISLEGNNGGQDTAEKGLEFSGLKTNKVAIDEQRLESAWLQAAEKNSSSYSKPEMNQILPQNGITCQNHSGSLTSLASKQWDAEMNNEFKALESSCTQDYHQKQIGGTVDHYVISPSCLHSNSYTAKISKEKSEYESGLGCGSLFCWNNHRSHKEKMEQRTHVKSEKSVRLSLFGQCGKKPKAPESRLR